MSAPRGVLELAAGAMRVMEGLCYVCGKPRELTANVGGLAPDMVVCLECIEKHKDHLEDLRAEADRLTALLSSKEWQRAHRRADEHPRCLCGAPVVHGFGRPQMFCQECLADWRATCFGT